MTAITEVFGNGLRLTAVAMVLSREIDGSSLSPKDFEVTNRTVVNVYTSTSPDPSGNSRRGRYIIVELDPEDEEARLYVVSGRKVIRKDAAAEVTWTCAITTRAGDTLAPTFPVTTSAVHNRVVDAFEQLSFTDAETGARLEYNLFKPRNYDPPQS